MKNWWLPILILTVFGVWLGSGFLLHELTNRGTFGDMFGAVNSLFSGLAFAVLIYTLFLQKNELRLQRKELSLTREELRGQRETMQAQNKQISLQNFEGTFFQMLRIHNELLGSIDIAYGGRDKQIRVLYGRDCFRKAWELNQHRFSSDSEIDDLEKRQAQIEKAFIKLWGDFEPEFGHYFRSLYNIIKFIDSSKIENKKHYTNIVRAQLSSQELVILFYNCIYHFELKFVPLIEKYSLLKHLLRKDVGSELDFKFYKECAFGQGE